MFGQCCFNVGDVKCTIGTGIFIDCNTGNSPHASVAGYTDMLSCLFILLLLLLLFISSNPGVVLMSRYSQDLTKVCPIIYTKKDLNKLSVIPVELSLICIQCKFRIPVSTKISCWLVNLYHQRQFSAQHHKPFDSWALAKPLGISQLFEGRTGKWGRRKEEKRE